MSKSPRHAAPRVPVAPRGNETFHGWRFAVRPGFNPEGLPIFDALEISPIVEDTKTGMQEALEHIEDLPRDKRYRLLWSLFGHTPGKGLTCIGDFTTEDEALEVARRLLGDLRPYESPPRK